nr:PfkB family carbohydrate kinase [Micromonospora sp. DSM 115978]
FVCVTLAERGCVVRADGTTTTYPAPPAEVVDSTGASDTFAAIRTACLIAGPHHSAAVAQAQAAAALTVSRPGAFDALLTARELQEQARSLPKPAY